MSHDVTVALATVIDISSPPANTGPEGVPGYEVLDELGRGGMGVVYKARQKSLNRVVALKMLLAGRGTTKELERFKTEAEAVGQLQHVNIVQVYEIGELDGRPYYTLEFCPNGNLSRRLDGKPLPSRDAAELVAHLARAMTAVHMA